MRGFRVSVKSLKWFAGKPLVTLTFAPAEAPKHLRLTQSPTEREKKKLVPTVSDDRLFFQKVEFDRPGERSPE